MLRKLPPRSRFIHCLLGYVTGGAAVVALLAVPSISFAQSLVSNQAAARLGLERAWFAQVCMDPTQHKVAQWLLDQDRLFALTSTGTIQAIHAETGETLWTTEADVGNAAAVGMAANSKVVALLSAGRLYLIDRADGHQLWSRQIGGVASAAPALSQDYAFVVLLNGRVEGYRLEDPDANVWQYQSQGRSFHSPTVTGKIVSWPSGSGLFYVAQADSPRVLFRIETNDEIVAAPAEQAPYLYIPSLDGYLYCVHESTGSQQWRYATGFAITSPPAIIGEKVFVASEEPALHAVDTLTGQPLWHFAGVKQFVASCSHHTFGIDRFGTLIVIDNESGGMTGRLATGEGGSALVNDQSDRIFLINNRGLVQCLREIGATEPTWHKMGDMASEEAEKQGEGSSTKELMPDEGGKSEDPAESPFVAEDSDSEAEDLDDSSVFEF